MAGTVTVSEEYFGGLLKVDWDWLSTAGGAADLVTANAYTGIVTRAVFIPDSAGTQPTDLYDVTVTDEDGADVLLGLGANLSNAATVQKHQGDGLGCVANDKLTVNVTNAGNAKGGRVILYIADLR